METNQKKQINKPQESEHERFLRITSKVDNLAKKGWELSNDKINKITTTIMQDLGYESAKDASSKAK